MNNSKNKIKVAHISEDGRGGGQLQYIKDIIGDSTFEQVLISPKLDESETHSQISLKLRVLNFKNLLTYLLFFVPELVQLVKTLKEQEFDLVVCHSAIQIKGVIAAFILRKPSIWVMHDSYLSKLSKLVFMSTYSLCQNYIFVSERSKLYYNNSFKRLSSKNQSVISSCIDHDHFYPKKSDLLPNETFNVITTCYINKWKGLELLIDIAHECKKSKHSQIHFHIVGPILDSRKAYAATLMNRIERFQLDNIIFHGYSNNILGFLNSAKLYLCTSIYESSPISVWEAMATALPIISYDVGDLSTIVNEYHCGTVIPRRDPKLFKDEILKYKEDPLRLKEAGNNSYRATFELFDKKTFVNQHQTFYQTVVDNHYENRPHQ